MKTSHGMLNKKGITLVELIVSMSILVIVALPAGSALTYAIRMFNREQERVALHQNTQIAMAEIKNVMMPAQWADILEAGGTKADGFIEVLSLRVISDDGMNNEIRIEGGRLIINGRTVAKNIRLEAVPVTQGQIVKGFGIRITSYSNTLDIGDFTITNEIYLRNKE